MSTSNYCCYACDARFPVREIPERSWGLWMEPSTCATCGAPVQVFRPLTTGTARDVVASALDLPLVTNRPPALRELLRALCARPAEVDRVLAAVERLDWDEWHAEIARNVNNKYGGERYRANLAQWPEVLRARADGSLRRSIAAATEAVKTELREFAAKWRR